MTGYYPKRGYPGSAVIFLTVEANNKSMNYRFLIYGLLGVIMEIIWTGMGSVFRGDLRMQGFSYLWMFPVYGGAVFLEKVHDHIRYYTWYFRGFIWSVIIFSIEFTAGILIQLTVGAIPWDYTGATLYSVAGLIRLDYFPVWFAVGLIFEKVHDFLKSSLKIRR